jgi:hypothetical protein
VYSVFSLTCDFKVLLNFLQPMNEKQVFFLQNRKLLIKHVRVGKEELVLVVIVGEFYQVQLE